MFSDPVKNIEQCGIQAGMEIADLGSGSGGYTIATAKALVSTGKVFAIDINKDLLNKVKNDGIKQGLYNIEVIWGDIDKPNGSKLRDFSVDMALVCNILFQVENKDKFIEEVKRILKKDGKVLLIDWDMDASSPLRNKKEGISKERAIELFAKYGFIKERDIDAGEHHYGMILRSNK